MNWFPSNVLVRLEGFKLSTPGSGVIFISFNRLFHSIKSSFFVPHYFVKMGEFPDFEPDCTHDFPHLPGLFFLIKTLHSDTNNKPLLLTVYFPMHKYNTETKETPAHTSRCLLAMTALCSSFLILSFNVRKRSFKFVREVSAFCIAISDFCNEFSVCCSLVLQSSNSV